MKKILLLMTMVLTCVGTWAQAPVVQVDNIGEAPYKLSDEDAAKIFELDNLTVVLDITTAASLSGRGAFFCVTDPNQSVPGSFSGTNTSYMACGHNNDAIAYIAAANSGQHFSTGTIPASSTIRVAYVFDKANNKFKTYIGNTNTVWTMDRNFGDYEIATPKMVKEDFPNANIYIGGGMAGNAAHENGDATIHKVRVYDGTLTINEIKNLDVVKEVDDLKNGRIYTFVTARGWMGAKSDNNNVISTAMASHNLTGSKEDVNFQWTVYQSENGNYYLYNIGKGMFMGVQATNNASIPFVASPIGKKLTFKVSSNTNYPIMFSTNNAAVVNHSTDKGVGLLSWTDGWGILDDGGSNHKIEHIGELSDEVLAKIERLVSICEIGYFRLKGSSGNYIDASSIYNDATAKSGQMSMKSDAACNLAGTIFYFDDDSRFLNYATGTYTKNTREIGTINDATKSTWTVEISERNTEKYVLTDISTTGSKNLHDNSGNRADKCSSVCGERHDFTIEEVTSLPVTITAAKYATFYAPVAVQVPSEVTAYSVTVNGDRAMLNKIEGGIIPANTGVVLYSENANTYNFNITNNAETITGNNLRGSAATTYFTEAGTYYALSIVDGEVGFYKDSFNNDRFQNNSHKAYLYVPTASSVKAFLFEESETTDIEESVVAPSFGSNAPVYDLCGRRVVNTVKGGIYIQNGKKFIVK